jgi:hypothetical protein
MHDIEVNTKLHLEASVMRLAILFLCSLAAIGCSRQRQTHGIPAQYKYVLSSDSLKGAVILDTSYSLVIRPSLAPRVVRLVERVDYTSSELDRASYQLAVTLEADTTVLQYFSKPISDFLGMSDQSPIFVDANFDGYTDIQMVEGMGANGQNIACAFYLFNPVKSCFDFDSSFTERFGENPLIDPDAKEIRTGGTTGCVGRCCHFETFRLVDKEFILVKREITERNDSTNKFISTTEILKEGRLVVTESDTTD